MARYTYANCQPAEGEAPDPTRIFRWAFGALPFYGSTPLLVQDEAQAQWSQLFWDMGFRHFPELQTVKVRAANRGQQHSLNGAVEIVDIAADDLDPMVIPDPLAYTAHEQAVMAERLYHGGMIGDRVPKWHPDAQASVSSGTPFNPSDHTVSAVNGYLLAPIPDAEKRRVMAAEMTGKKRDGILRNPANQGF
ncbi:DUF2744 domain-containing protein [Nocardia rhizosphaerihabitans]|uniref:phage gene 29 protein family protein n=1 Tax=Nocardia rhizosphaerihabitans TaxID=1691570 RepID=UPI00366EEE9D